MPHFALVTTDGDALGPVELGRPDWPDGAIIYRGASPTCGWWAGSRPATASMGSTCSSSKKLDRPRTPQTVT